MLPVEKATYLSNLNRLGKIKWYLKLNSAIINDIFHNNLGSEQQARVHCRSEKRAKARRTGVQDESKSALCKNTLQGLRELGLDIGASFFPELLDTFEHDAVERLAALRSAIAAGETGRLRKEAHSLKGASLTIGAHRMAEICHHLEHLGIAQSAESAPELLVRLDREFDRVKAEIQQERLIL